MMLSIEQRIWQQATLHPDKLAVKSGKDTATYSELVSRIIAAKVFFQSLPDYTAGNTVILAAGKQIEFLYAYLGAHLAGLIVTPIDVETNPTRFEYIADVIKPFCIIGFDKQETFLTKISLKEFKEMPVDYSKQSTDFPDNEKVADILFTTGTTGVPKGVPLTYKNEAAAALNINAYIGNTSDDIELLALPVSHSFGLGRVRCCLSNGQTLHLLGSFVNVKRIYRTIEEENITGFTMVPASWKFLQKMSGDQLGHYGKQLRYIEMGSAYISEDDKRHLAHLLPTTRITMYYGLTEASRSAFMEFHADSDKLSTVGKASPNTDIQIFNDQGQVLPCGEEGEICIKGDHVTKGYLNTNPASSFYSEGYFRTGDSGTIDSDGYISIKARIKELINVGGKKVAPTEVDEQILKIAGVKDCACVGTRDPEGILGEVVKAFVVKGNNELTFDFITKQLSGKLEAYKIPVIYEWIDCIPKTSNGKIQRNLLKND